MQTAGIIDIAIAAFLLAFLIGGAHRGLLRTIAGLVIVVLALVGANYSANCLMPVAEKYAQPYLKQQVQSRIEKSLAKEGGAASASADSRDPNSVDGQEIMRALGLMKLDTDASDSVARAAEGRMKETGASLRTALEESVTETILHTMLFALCFFLLMLLLKLLVRALDLVLKLPGLNFLNRLGGAALGVLEGVLLLFFAVWMLRRFGISFETKTVEKTVLLRFFTDNTPLSVLPFL